jgi:hypothetical protein
MAPDRPISTPLNEQIQRVLARLNGSNAWDETEPVDVFRIHGRLPPILTDLCADLLRTEGRPGGPELLTFTLCFSACLFPQRPGHIGETRLRLRLAAFLAFWEALEKASTAREALKAHWAAQGLGAGEGALDDLLADLSAADCIPHDNPCEARQEKKARLEGAALYLGTCHSTLLARIGDNWRVESPFLRFLRTNLPVNPSSLARPDDDEGKSGPSVEEWLHAQLPLDPFGHGERAIQLEKKTRGEARKWGPQADANAREFWELLIEKLTSGFPYYAFHSKISTFWAACLERYRPRVSLREAPPSLRAADGCSEDELRLYREGARFLRFTFHRRTAKADETEQVRRVIDALWSERLERRLLRRPPRRTTGGNKPAAVQEIAARFPILGASAISMQSYRLRRRLRAYAMARLGRDPNSAIQLALGEEDAATERLIAALAKSATPDETLLWPFLAHMCLYPKLSPPHSTRWSWSEVVHEIWHWVRDGMFLLAVRQSAERGSRVNRAAWAFMSEPGIRQFMNELREISSEKELDEYLAGDPLEAIRERAMKIVGELIGDWDFLARTDQYLALWKRLALLCWIVPVWYLTVLERLDGTQVIQRLTVDPEEAEVVRSLAKAMAVCVPSARRESPLRRLDASVGGES